jgi:hypothetical protein
MEFAPGSQLLPLAIDAIAVGDPDRPWASIPISSKLSDGYRDVSFHIFANAINRASWFLESTFGKATSSETFAFIGKSDMRYHIFAMAAAKTGFKVSRLWALCARTRALDEQRITCDTSFSRLCFLPTSTVLRPT